MRITSAVSLFVTLGLIHSVHSLISAPPNDLEGSGDDFDTFDSGSGAWSEKVEKKNINVRTSGKDVTLYDTNLEVGAKNTLHGSSGKAQRPTKDRSGFVILGKSKGYLERKEILIAVIAGAVTGGILAASLAAILIYKWQKKDDEVYVLGQQRASDEDYDRTSAEEVL